MKIKGGRKPVHFKEVFRKAKKRTIILCGILLLVITAAVVAGVIFLKADDGKNTGFPFGGMPGGKMSFTLSENMTAVSGVTSVGVTEEVFGVENLTAGLRIEEVYISSNDNILAGTKILKLSEASVEEARDELEKALNEADLACRSGLIEYEQSIINAKYDLDSKVLNGKQAKAVYDENLSKLQTSVDKAKEQLLEAQEKIAEYQSYVSDDSYRSYFGVDEYQAIYDETLQALMQNMDEWGVSWPQVTGQGGVNTEDAAPGGAGSGGAASEGVPGQGGGMMYAMSEGDPEMAGYTVSGGDADQGDQQTLEQGGPSSDQIQVLGKLYKVLEKQLKKLEQAEGDYGDALANAAFELQTLELQLPQLEQALAEAEKNYQSQVLQARVTYEKTLANADSAQSDYETAVQQAEITYETLKNNRKDAEDNLKLFVSSVGDGYLYASGDGTVLRMMVRAGANLNAESTVFMYSNPEEMTVTVSVKQENIADISLDDKVYIQTEKNRGFEGIVAKVNPISNSDSRTNVTYSVVVKFTGDTAGVSVNESVTVVFGMDEEAIEKAVSMSEGGSEKNQIQQGGEPNRPEGMSAPEGIELPEGANPPWGDGMPQDGNIPEGGGFPRNGNGQMSMPQGAEPENRNTGKR